ncbi:MAG: prepilin-type N-terminal cleavage/methylation domain-containing protein [Gemmatimonadetes bacterium]|nr:prepilin-type N-terminal cleavage/methylation domain-containing protein [Gemmatimonadota bacterium]
MTDRRGFTLVELITAVVLVGIVGTAIYQLLVSNQRIYREQSQRVDVNQAVRAAISILPGEIRELNAGDPAGSDIILMTGSLLQFKSMRSLYFLCQAPAGTQVVLDANLFFGIRPLDQARDSLLLFAEGDPLTRADDSWLHADVVSTTPGTACPGGGASVTVNVGGVTAPELAAVESGAPVRGFEVVEVRLYADGLGAQWLGRRRFQKSGSWTATEPIVGPLSSGGLQLAYYDSTGAVTATPGNVARISITVETQGTQRVRGTSGQGMEYLLQDLMTHVAIRNNPTY